MNPNKMICFIKDYEYWDAAIHEHAVKFHEAYSIYPNIMLSAKPTWDKIDEYANLFNPENIVKDADYTGDEEIKSISTFATLDYIIDFCLDDKIKEDYFVLVFDEDPVFDGEAVDDEDVAAYRRIA